MTDTYILDDEGQPVIESNLVIWRQWFETCSPDRVLVQTIFGDGDVVVSTIFLGFDHRRNFFKGAPILWETMIFGGPLDGTQKRYETRAKALRGHEDMVRKVRESQR